ncbi:MAG TPA: DUF2059 domain-containing protein [Sphingomicrobium sp.]|jgi:hypothetical protein|nr:DUF2059 domain-containing protein [Sphingomicrobium sp.]
MRLVVSALVIAFSVPSVSALAQQPSEPTTSIAIAQPDKILPPSPQRMELARRYIGAAISADQFVDAMRSAIAAGLSDNTDADMDEATKAESEKKMKRFLVLYEPKLRERMPNLLEAYAQVYAREFSAEELQEMVAFAQSPAGHHYLSRRLSLELDPAVLMQEQGFQNDALPIMKQIQKEMCQEATAKRIAAGDKKAKCPLSNEADTRAS